jgi:hypothetical protein
MDTPKAGWKYKYGQKVFLKGTKSTGLPMSDVLKHETPPWCEVSGIVNSLLRNHGKPEYSVYLDWPWRQFFEYIGLSFTEDDIYAEGEVYHINYLDEGLFEL